MTFYELYNELSKLYPLDLSCEWDNDGIMCVCDLNYEVKSVLFSLDVTEDVIDYAIKNGFNTIVSHHPAVFKAQKAITPANYTQRKMIKAIKNNVGIMSFHTRLDAASGGVNDNLSAIIGLSDIIVDEADPVGRIGMLSRSVTIEEFAEQVKIKLGTPLVLYSGNKQVNRVYVVGGDGKDLISNAIAQDCDTILTGRASYNTAVDACDMGINIVEAGHFYTEHHICYILENKVKALLPNVKTEVYNSNKINIK